MIKYISAITVCLLPVLGSASDYNYDVSGDGDGGYYYGDIEANRGSRDVDGYLYDENGDSVYFSGEWTGKGEVEGYDENGNYIQLEVD